MEKKVKCGSEVFSAPMGQILERLQVFGEFKIRHFGNKVILEDPIDRPFLVNELEPQHLLHDRRKVYEHLEKYGIPVPRYALANREKPYQELDYFVEEDFVEVHGNRFGKPFAEKPVDGDDHSIRIYYPTSAGGGMKELFRKIGIRKLEECDVKALIYTMNLCRHEEQMSRCIQLVLSTHMLRQGNLLLLMVLLRGILMAKK